MERKHDAAAAAALLRFIPARKQRLTGRSEAQQSAMASCCCRPPGSTPESTAAGQTGPGRRALIPDKTPLLSVFTLYESVSVANYALNLRLARQKAAPNLPMGSPLTGAEW